MGAPSPISSGRTTTKSSGGRALAFRGSGGSPEIGTQGRFRRRRHPLEGKKMSADKPKPAGDIIFRPWIPLKNGKRLYASQVGKKAFPIKVKPKDKKTD